MTVESSGAICDSDVMAILVANGAELACDMGASPSLLTLTPGPPHVATASPPLAPLAVVSDFVPLTNIKTFGMCSSPFNPAVQAATTAADGVFTPAPCVPGDLGSVGPARAGDRLRRACVSPDGHLPVRVAGHHHGGGSGAGSLAVTAP